MSDKGRKPEDRSNVHKGNRGSPVSGLTQLGSSATMMPHGSYEITSSLHHHLPYGTIMRPPAIHHMTPHMGRLTNDLGPPIFMPSLNLGIPKPQSSSSSSPANSSCVLGSSGVGSGTVNTASTISKTTKSSLPPQTSMNAPTAFMADMIPFPSAFHPPHTMRAPSGQSHASYIPVSAPPPPHPSSINMKLPPSQSLSSSTTGIAKPTPIPASVAPHTSGGIVRPTPKSASSNQTPGTTLKQPIPTSSKGVMSSVGGGVSKGDVPGNLGVYGFQPHVMSYGLLNTAAAVSVSAPPSHGQLSKMLLGGGGSGSQQHPSHTHSHASSNRPGRSDGSSGGLSKTASAQVSSAMSHKAGGYVVDGYPSRPSIGLSTSSQPSSTAATYMDTKMEHPPQPTAVPLGPISSLPVPSSGVPSAPPTSPPPPPLLPHNNSTSTTTFGTNGGVKDRPITAEAAASNLIISKQALTGKQIASITGSATTATMGQSSQPESTYTSPLSNSSMETTGANRSASDVVPSREQGTGIVDWSTNAQSRPSASISSSYVPPGQGVGPASPSSVADIHDGGGEGGGSTPVPQQPQQNLTLQSNGSSADPTSSSMATSSVSSSFSAAGHISAGGGVMGSPSKNLTASPGGTGLSSSPRPHILRGVKRPHESSWKESSHHSPASSALLNKLSNNSSLKQKGSRLDYGPPMSPTSHDTGLSNHLNTTLVKSEPGGDMTASPRKKPRKQNVVANDDQYASNVPDGFVSTATPESQGYHDGQGEEFANKPHPPLYNSLASRNSKIKGEPGGKEVEMRYLSQLKRCPYPINGVYKVHHRAARNHFRRHADIKHREESRLSVYEIADDKSAMWRATGWKVLHFTSQLQEMTEVEEDILKTMQRLQDSVNNLDQTGTCQVDAECHSSFKELVQGNLDRSSRVLSHFSNTRSEIDKVLEHKSQVSDLLKKYSTSKSTTQSLLLSLNHHNKNCS